MRDIFEDLSRSTPADPMEAARRGMRPPLRQRFYTAVAVAERDERFVIVLDGRPVRTPAGRELGAPVESLAQAIAAEWEAQRDVIDPASMPLTRLANAIIDRVADAPGPVADEVRRYLGSDLVCYRAGTPEGLVARQARAWDPVLDWAREALGARFILGEGIGYVPQPQSALTAAGAAIPDAAAGVVSLWRLGAVNAITTLSGSALIALALLHGRLTVDEAWAAAHVDENWNMDTWGRDELALERRAFREAEMRAAAAVIDALRQNP
jgi:chaperone required for assembly of F1-ATPase